MHSRDPTGKFGETIPRVYEGYVRFFENNSNGMTEAERQKRRETEQDLLSPTAPLGSDPQARPRSEVASQNNNATSELTIESNHSSALAADATMGVATLSASSNGKKRKSRKSSDNETRKRVCTRDRTQELVKEMGERADMHKALFRVLKQTTTRSTIEIMNDYEQVEEKYANATSNKRKKFYARCLKNLEKELEMVDDDGGDDDSDSDDSSLSF